jgi:hypothetical protein
MVYTEHNPVHGYMPPVGAQEIRSNSVLLFDINSLIEKYFVILFSSVNSSDETQHSFYSIVFALNLNLPILTNTIFQ